MTIGKNFKLVAPVAVLVLVVASIAICVGLSLRGSESDVLSTTYRGIIIGEPISIELPAQKGTVVTHESGARIEVPEGATEEQTTVSIAEVEPPVSPLEVRRAFDFSVGGAELLKPVTIHIPFELGPREDASQVQAVHWDEGLGEWELVPGEVDEAASAIAVTTSDLSTWSWIVETVADPIEGIPGADEETPTSMPAPVKSPTPTSTATPTSVATPSPTPTSTATPTSVATPSPTPTSTATPTSIATPSPTPASTDTTVLPSDCVEDLDSLNGGSRRSGIWDSDCLSTNRAGSYARFYSFRLAQQTEIQIDLESSQNTYVYLLRGAGATGEVVVSNNDAATGNSNSQIFVTLASGDYTIEATTYAGGESGEFVITIVPVLESTHTAPERCLPVRDLGAGDRVIDTLVVGHEYEPDLGSAYLSACLEGAWRQMESLGELELLNPVGIAVVDTGLYEPSDTDSYRNLVLRHEFDWDRITVRDMVVSRGDESEEARLERSTHGTGVASILVAVNHEGQSGLAKPGQGYDPSFSGVVSSVPTLDYKLHFYEHTGSDGKRDFDSVLRALDDIIERKHEIDVVNLSLGLQCRTSARIGPTDILCLRHPANLFNQTREFHAHFKKMPEVLFVVAAGNKGEDARFTTPANLTTSSIPDVAHLVTLLDLSATGTLKQLTTVALILTAPNVITVGAIDPQTSNRWIDDDRTASNYGPAITVAAPGAKVYALNSTVASDAYYRESGTSHAAPLVTGVVAFLRSIDPDISAEEVIEILQETGAPTMVCTVNDPGLSVEECPDRHMETWKVMNADAAVRELLTRRGISVPGTTPTSGTSPPKPDTSPTSDTSSTPDAGEPFVRSPAKDLDFPAGDDDPVGIWSDGTTMWVSDWSDAKVYAYNMATKERDPDRDIDTLVAAGNNRPTGVWSDKTTIWVADSESGKIYAYNLETKQRDAGKDFDTLIHRPADIWSDGTTMWVQDWRTNQTTRSGGYPTVKMYAYNMATKQRDAGKDFDDLLDYRSEPRGGSDLQPWGIWSDGTTMWVTKMIFGDWGSFSYSTNTGYIYAYNLETKGFDGGKSFFDGNEPWLATTLNAAGNNSPAGIWSDGTTMWVVDRHDNKIYAYNLDTGQRDAGMDFDILNDAGSHSPQDIWSDGTTMWVADWHDEKIYAYNLETKQRDAGKEVNTLVDSGSDPPRGIWSDGRTMWVAYWGYVSGTTRALTDFPEVHAHSLLTNQREYGPGLNRLYLVYNDHPQGIWSDGTTMWVADAADAKIYAYDLATRDREADKDFDTLGMAGNDSPTGIWSDGATMWVADGEDAKIYAYSLETRERLPDKDFDTLVAAGNSQPTGIWSDGMTMWAADRQSHKIYAYNMP